MILNSQQEIPPGATSDHFEIILHEVTSIPDLEVNGWKEYRAGVSSKQTI